MKSALRAAALLGAAISGGVVRTCGAADDPSSPLHPANRAPPAKPAARPRQAAVAPTTEADRHSDDKESAAPDAPKFVSESKWVLAGYNNNEIVYQVFVTDQDTRIIRCVTQVNGFYLDNGKRLGITDRQVTTLFPNQEAQVGTWMDMDQPSGANYVVKCHAVS